MSIAQFEGKALVFNNGVVDVVQGETSLVDENKVAHIPEGNVEIDNLTIIKNADNELEVPFDNNTIYRDSEDGFIKANVGDAVHDSKIILCTQVGSDPAGPVGSFTLNQDSNKTITIPIPEPEVKEYTGGTDIEVTSEGVINYTGSGGGGTTYTAGDGIQISNDEISVKKDEFIALRVTQEGWNVRIDLDTPITETGVTYEQTFDNQALYDFIDAGYYADNISTVTSKGFTTFQGDNGEYIGTIGTVFDDPLDVGGIGYESEYTRFIIYIDGAHLKLFYRNDSPSLTEPLNITFLQLSRGQEAA